VVIPDGFDVFYSDGYPCPDLTDVGIALLAALLLALGLRALRRRATTTA
jgi:hypothetical protein